MKIEIIELWHPVTECTACGKETPLKWSIPMYEGKKVDTTKTDEWAGMPVCKGCYDDDARGEGRSDAPPRNKSRGINERTGNGSDEPQDA